MDVKGLSGAEAFLGLLGKMGIEYIFASPGSEWAPVWEYLAKPYSPGEAIPQYLSSRHEEISVGMASGYAKATGTLPAVMVHTTVGALHATMALRGALHEEVPMVVFTGESIGFGEEQGPDPGAQWLRHLADVGGPARLVEPCVKWSVGVNTPALMPATIQRACQLAMSIPRGPVFVSLPMEYLFATMATSAPAAASLPHCPTAGPRGARVAVLGESPLRPELPYWGLSIDLCLAGETESSLGQLIERLTERIAGDATRARRAAEWGQRHQQRKQAWAEEALALKNRRPIDTRWIVRELNEVLPSDAIVVDETITHRSHIVSHLDRLKPGAFFSGFCGGLGTGLGTALGVKAAAPVRPVIVTIGDGAFSYNPVLAALGVSQEYGMPLLIVMFNNHGYLSQKSGVPRYYPEGWAVKSKTFVGTSITPSPDYAAIARAFEGYGEKVEEPSEVRPALERGLKAVASGQLALIDFWLDAVN